jgi:hypothetical protein
VTFRFATDRRGRVATTAFADNSRCGSTWAAKSYTGVGTRKNRRPHATRIPARVSLHVIWARWREGAFYDREIHQADGEINTTTDTPIAA